MLTMASPRTVFLLFTLSCIIETTHAFDVVSWLKSMLPDKGDGSIQDELKCYSLPYGGIGFLSHILTYWTLLFISIGRSPWRFKQLTSYRLDLCLGLFSLVSTLILSIFTIIRCRTSWPFVLLATWKMMLSFSLGCSSVHRSVIVKRFRGYKPVKQFDKVYNPEPAAEKKEEEHKTSYAPALWPGIFYTCGVVIGLVGLTAIMVKVWPTRTKAMMIITGVFSGLVLLAFAFGLLIGICVWKDEKDDDPSDNAISSATFLTFMSGFLSTFGAVGMIGILAAFYSDWILAAIEVQHGGSWAGLPSSDVAGLYWAYFVAKRLPFFSM
ncbi:MAG: hypothetical protein MMC33_003572 [Icmadophila ericetorum]|nr:hypothetical protein [Icmadophila ericetorum]